MCKDLRAAYFLFRWKRQQTQKGRYLTTHNPQRPRGKRNRAGCAPIFALEGAPCQDEFAGSVSLCASALSCCDFIHEDTRRETLPWELVARLELLGVRTVEQFCVFLGMRDKTRAQIMTMLRRSPRQKTNRPGLE
jgi:hypothetical protein